MGKAWVKRWSPEKKGVKGSFVEILEIKPTTSIEEIQWRLPPSKSHAIRLLALAGQSEQSILLQNMEHAGDDVVAMRRCLRQMGVSCSDVGPGGEVLPSDPNLDDQPPEGTVAWRIEGVASRPSSSCERPPRREFWNHIAHIDGVGFPFQCPDHVGW